MLNTYSCDIDRQVFQAVYEWRHHRARADQVPAYVVLPNALLYRVVEARPQTEEALRGLKGMGPGRMAKYGADLVALLGTFPPPPPRVEEPPPPAPEPRPWDDDVFDLWGDEAGSHREDDEPRLRIPQTYRVVIEYSLDDAARRQLVRDLGTTCESGPVLHGLRDALSSGPARVSIRIESEHAA